MGFFCSAGKPFFCLENTNIYIHTQKHHPTKTNFKKIEERISTNTWTYLEALQNGGGKMTARDIDVEPRWETIQIAPAKREANPNPTAIDSVNLNVNGDQGVTMTFVETVDDAEDA